MEPISIFYLEASSSCNHFLTGAHIFPYEKHCVNVLGKQEKDLAITDYYLLMIFTSCLSFNGQQAEAATHDSQFNLYCFP